MNFIKQFSDYIKESVAPLRVYRSDDHHTIDGESYWKGFLSKYMDWNIRWNHNLSHNKDHDMNQKIEDRTDYNKKYINSKIKKIVDEIDQYPVEDYPSGFYNVNFEMSEFVVVMVLKQESKDIFISTILSNNMIPFKQDTEDIVLFEKIS